MSTCDHGMVSTSTTRIADLGVADLDIACYFVGWRVCGAFKGVFIGG